MSFDLRAWFQKKPKSPDLVHQLRKECDLVDAMVKGIQKEMQHRPVTSETVWGYWNEADRIWKDGCTAASQQGLGGNTEVEAVLSRIKSQKGKLGALALEAKHRWE
jgi:hypothetical protein